VTLPRHPTALAAVGPASECGDRVAPAGRLSVYWEGSPRRAAAWLVRRRAACWASRSTVRSTTSRSLSFSAHMAAARVLTSCFRHSCCTGPGGGPALSNLAGFGVLPLATRPPWRLFFPCDHLWHSRNSTRRRSSHPLHIVSTWCSSPRRIMWWPVLRRAGIAEATTSPNCCISSCWASDVARGADDHPREGVYPSTRRRHESGPHAEADQQLGVY